MDRDSKDFEDEIRSLSAEYEVLGVLGQGSYGIVVKALNKPVSRIEAVKIFKEGPNQDINRIKREAQVLAGLDHPHIVKVLRIGQTTTGQPFIAYEYLEGMTLADFFKTEKNLSARMLKRIFVQILEGLQYLHERNVIHRDLKPSNIILTGSMSPATTTFGHKPVVKIVDFGLAKQTDRGDVSLTSTGVMMGTPAYMCPHSVTSGVFDNRSDLYAVGCMMYESLAGKPPLVGETDLHTLYLRQTSKPEPIRDFRPADSLPQFISDCLDPSPEKRPVSASDMLSRLRKVSFNRNRKPGILIAVGVGAALLAGVSAVGFLDWTKEPEDSRVQAGSSKTNYRSIAAKLKSTTAEELHREVEKVCLSPTVDGPLVKDLLEKLNALGEPPEPAESYAVHLLKAKLYERLNDGPKAISEFRNAIEKCKMADGKYAARASALLRSVSLIEHKNKNFKGARQDLEKAIAIKGAVSSGEGLSQALPLEFTLDNEEGGVGKLKVDLMRLELDSGNHDRVLELAPETRTELVKYYRDNEAESLVLECEELTADALFFKGRREEAVAILDRVNARLKGLPSDSGQSFNLRELAKAYELMGELEKATQCRCDSFECMSEVLPRDLKSMKHSCLDVASNLRKLGRIDEARGWERKAAKYVLSDDPE